jgi:hypothetical protein
MLPLAGLQSPLTCAFRSGCAKFRESLPSTFEQQTGSVTPGVAAPEIPWISAHLVRIFRLHFPEADFSPTTLNPFVWRATLA